MTKSERSRTDLVLLSKRVGRQFDNWPEALTLRQIGLLISRTYWKRDDSWHGLYERIEAAVKCGDLAMDGPPAVRDGISIAVSRRFAGYSLRTGEARFVSDPPSKADAPTVMAQTLAGYLHDRQLPELLAVWLAPYMLPCEETTNTPKAPAPQKAVKQKRHLLDALGTTYPELHSAFKRNDEWLKECRAGKNGLYYLEDVEAQCAEKWPGRARTATAHELNSTRGTRPLIHRCK
ncbi:MAG: hypothetical protein JNJ44_11405 [Zoogloeaceae bacterium]|nr:hypothetical protein [Zoogloeaceae bacterium]